MNPEQPPKPIINYKKPPIIERVVSAVGDVALETFYARFEGWKEIIQPHFPDYDPIKEWKLNIEMKGEVPILTDAPPEVQITHRFWRLNAKGKRFMSMRVLPNQLTLNLHRETDRPHQYEELHAEFEKWLPQWMAHFGVKGCASVALDYINLISAGTTPQFMDQQGGIQVGRALTVFAGVPGRYVSIIPPYDCKMGLMIDPKRPAIFALRVFSPITPQEFGLAVRIDFHAAVAKDGPHMTSLQVLSEARFLHTIILEQFEALFTQDAKRTFEPS